MDGKIAGRHEACHTRGYPASWGIAGGVTLPRQQIDRIHVPRDAARVRTRRRPSRATPFASDLDYLEEELRWIEARARRIAIQLRLEESRRREVGHARLGPPPDPEESPGVLEAKRRHYAAEEGRVRRAVDARLAATRAAGTHLALDRLQALHGLDDAERRVLLLAAAPCFSLRYLDLYYAIAGGVSSGESLQVDAVFNFLAFTATQRIHGRRMFSSDGALVRNDLVKLDSERRHQDAHDLLTATVKIATRTFRYLVGDNALGDEFRDFSSVEEPRATFDQVVLDEADRRRVLSVVERHDEYLRCREAWGFDGVIRYGRGVLILFHGKPGTGKTMTAHAVAHRMGRKVLSVDIPAFLRGSEAERFLPGLFREARLQDAVLFFDECEVFFHDRAHGNKLMTLLLTELERFEGVAILATNMPEVLDQALDRRILVRVRFPEPDRDARLEIWRKHLPPKAPLAADVDLGALASRYELSGGLIKNAVLMAVAEAFHSGGQGAVISMRHLERAAEDQLAGSGEVWIPFAEPRVRLADVALPEDLARLVGELVEAARMRGVVLDRWGIGRHLTRGKGVSALMTGDPGTGKTLCAEAITAELGRPLLAVPVPTVLSMWYGETEKSIERVFRRARAGGAVLFLDECDSLLVGRDEQQVRRHDIGVVNVLLDQIERHDGVILLATNLPHRLDRALGRRITYHLRFPLPDAALRARIWRSLIPDTAPVAPDVDPDRLGRRFRLAGGHIKNAVLKAAFRAARAGGAITQGLLEGAAEEEVAAAGGDERRLGFLTERGSDPGTPEAEA